MVAISALRTIGEGLRTTGGYPQYYVWPLVSVLGAACELFEQVIASSMGREIAHLDNFSHGRTSLAGQTLTRGERVWSHSYSRVVHHTPGFKKSRSKRS